MINDVNRHPIISKKYLVLPCVFRGNQRRAVLFILDISFSPMLSFVLVRRNETICCLIGFGIGVGCCILYRLISNLFSASSIGTRSSNAVQRDASVATTSSDRISPANESRHRSDGDEMTWSEISSSLSTVNLLHDSYHSNSLTADSGVECSELPARYHQRYTDLTDNDDDNETLLRKYDSDTALHHDRRKETIIGDISMSTDGFSCLCRNSN